MDMPVCPYYFLAHENLPGGLLRPRHSNSLLVCCSVLSDSWSEFPAFHRRTFRHTHLHFFRGRFDSFLRFFPVLVAARRAREEDHGLVAGIGREPGCGAFAGAAVLPAQTPGRRCALTPQFTKLARPMIESQ